MSADTAERQRLKKAEFDKQYRFRNSRSKESARCAICTHCKDGCCCHPLRLVKISLSEKGFSSRYDLSDSRVCDLVDIPMPDGVVIPELGETQYIAIHGMGLSRVPFRHGNPNCPYIAFAVSHRNLTQYDSEFLEVVELSRFRMDSLWEACELPGCTDHLGIMPGPDEYMKRQGFDNGYRPEPMLPLPVVPDADHAEETLPLELGLPEALWPYRSDIWVPWPEQTIRWGVNRVRRLMANREIAGDQRHRGLDWYRLHFILNTLGWMNVAARVPSDVRYEAVELPREDRPYSEKWDDETVALGVQYIRSLSHHKLFGLRFESEEILARMQVGWDQWRAILSALGDYNNWGQVINEIDFLIATKQRGVLYCIPCSKQRDIFGQIPNPVNIGGQPYCPNCRTQLVDTITHGNAMEQ